MAIPVTVTSNMGTTGTLAAPGAVSTTETIAGVYVGAVLEVNNASVSSVNVTFNDPGHTAAGNTGTQAAAPVAAGATRRWRLSRPFVDDLSGNITVTFSATSSITAEVIA